MAYTRPANATTSNQAAAKRPPPAAPKSRYEGIKASKPRNGFLTVGEYIVEGVGFEEGNNPKRGVDTYKSTFKIVEIISGGEGFEVDGEAFDSQDTSGKGQNAGLSRVKSMMMAFAGFEDEGAYDEFDPHGHYIAASAGHSNEFSAPEDGSEPNIAVGKRAYVKVTKGKLREDGDYYRQYAWQSIG